MNMIYFLVWKWMYKKQIKVIQRYALNKYIG